MKTKLILILAVAVLSACSNDMTPADGLKARLAETAADGKILFGQQDALMYGHSWKSEPGDSLDRSDIKDVCGKHPAAKRKDLRPVMILCQTARKDQLEKMAVLRMIASIFIGHVYFWGDVHRKNGY